MKHTLLIAGFILVSNMATAAISPPRQEELHDLILEDCGACHGLTLKGSLGPSLLPSALSGKTKQLLITTILNGRKNTAMPAWRGVLTEEDAAWIAEQLLNGTTGAPK